VKSILISGASKGIGKAAALFFSTNGIQVFAGVRTVEDGKILEDLGGGKIIPIQLDVTNSTQIKNSIVKIEEIVGKNGLQGLVNNAGIAVSSPMEFVPIDELRNQIEINFIGVVALTQACMPLIRIGKGRIVNISSISGMFSYPFVGPYSASKFALEAFTNSFRRELLMAGIHVASVQPGNVDTPIWDSSYMKADEISKNFPAEAHQHYPFYFPTLLDKKDGQDKKGMSPQKVVDKINHALFSKRPKTKYPVGNTAIFFSTIGKFIPDKFFDSIIKIIFSREN
jgi:NAD(P)-dependent dehydrogenase (short-subunit alcohol dehydrogenase family)